ncbi:MAG TPA: hypothetical protein VK615_08950 [Candidatus Binatia bacterium]|nr:hypothetical protein [Candidatus Binatia bacterium]
MQIFNWLIRVTTITAVWILLSGCKSAPKSAVDPNIAAVSTTGLRLGMTPAEVMDVSARRLYKEDQQNQDRLSDLAQKQKERATIRLNRIRSVASQGVFAFNSNAVTLTLQFARNRLVLLDERHTGLGEEALRTEMKALSPQFNFVKDRTETDSGAQWVYQGKNPGAHVRVDFRFVPITPASPPMSSYKIVIADPAWANEPQRFTQQ